jgi:hypothetical protein
MKKSEVIAKCLVNSGMKDQMEEAKQAVHQIFLEEFPKASFSNWDQDIDDKVAENIICAVGRASRINVRKFIQDLCLTDNKIKLTEESTR